MRHLTQQELLSESGAQPEELAAIEERGLIVPCRARRLFGAFGGQQKYYTESQLDVLRWLLKARRAAGLRGAVPQVEKG